MLEINKLSYISLSGWAPTCDGSYNVIHCHLLSELFLHGENACLSGFSNWIFQFEGSEQQANFY